MPIKNKNSQRATKIAETFFEPAKENNKNVEFLEPTSRYLRISKKNVIFAKIITNQPKMTPFLQQIAKRYYTEFGENLSKVAFVFPNRRAGLFLRQAIAHVTDKPIFAPDIYAINDLFFRESELKQADKITLLFTLYKIYKELIAKKNQEASGEDQQQDEETFDRFCYLGEMILADFNDIDKYMADAKQVFTNICDLKEIENHIDWMSDEQKEIIEKFWNVFLKKTDENANEEYKKRFAEIWEILPELYANFKNALRTEGIAYDGMIFRDVAESDADLHLDDYERVVFVGFNALTTTERKLFEKCQKSNKGDYYFDYQSPEITAHNNIAAQFIEENKKFKSRHELEPAQENDRKIELIAIPSDIGQTKQVYNILDSLQKENPENANLRTVVVLPNEQLLLPQLHAIPESIKTVNITMGYPLSLTPVAALIQHIAVAQRNKREVTHNDGTTTNETFFYYKHVLAILNHPLIAESESCAKEVNELNKKIHDDNLYLISEKTDEIQKSDLLRTIFSTSNNDALSFAHYFKNVIEQLESLPSLKNEQIESEFLQNYKAALTRICHNLEKFKIEITSETFLRLLSQLTASQTVAFRGEPVEGLQLMGTLETRALDFENVIITSFNEDMFPRKSNTPSLIPYNLRRAFNLPTHEYHDAIFAYNFYRLIYRARRVYLIYDSRTGSQTGEVSRYAAQLEYLYGLPIDKKSVSYEVNMDQSTLEIKKEGEVAEKLDKFTAKANNSKMISASAIDNYITCPVKFYFSNVEGLNNNNEVSESVEANTFGSIFHETMQKLYDSDDKNQSFVNKTVTKEAIENMIENVANIEKLIKDGFQKYQFNNRQNFEITGQNRLIFNVIKNYVKKTLEHDRERTPFKYCASEKEYQIKIQLNNKEVTLKGIIDRVDKTDDGTTHIIDYKTGHNVGRNFAEVEDLFDAKRNKDVKAIRQTFLYCILYKKYLEENNLKINKLQPLIYEFKNLDNNDITQGEPRKTKTPVDDFSEYEEGYTEKLKETLEEIFDEGTPFKCTDDTQNCEHCDFRRLCGR